MTAEAEEAAPQAVEAPSEDTAEAPDTASDEAADKKDA